MHTKRGEVEKRVDSRIDETEESVGEKETKREKEGPKPVTMIYSLRKER